MHADDLTETRPGWLSPDELAALRGQVPLVYVDAVPVRLDEFGRVVEVGVLLRAMPDGTVSRAVVSGRVLYGETIRQALLRHLTKDLGNEAQPRLPASPAPFTVVEYFPDPTVSGFYDPRQHAVALAYVVPLDGICRPSQDSLDFTWLSPDEADTKEVRAEMTGGQDRLVRLALAYTGSLA